VHKDRSVFVHSLGKNPNEGALFGGLEIPIKHAAYRYLDE
jgi:hypothetical protein